MMEVQKCTDPQTTESSVAEVPRKVVHKKYSKYCLIIWKSIGFFFYKINIINKVKISRYSMYLKVSTYVCIYYYRLSSNNIKLFLCNKLGLYHSGTYFQNIKRNKIQSNKLYRYIFVGYAYHSYINEENIWDIW